MLVYRLLINRNRLNLILIVLISSLTIRMESKSVSRGKIRKYNSPRIIHHTSSKSKDYYDHPDVS